jgi:hypothetical protein
LISIILILQTIVLAASCTVRYCTRRAIDQSPSGGANPAGRALPPPQCFETRLSASDFAVDLVDEGDQWSPELSLVHLAAIACTGCPAAACRRGHPVWSSGRAP